MSFTIDIPKKDGNLQIEVEVGSSIIFIGANGSGKTRLATYIENTLSLNAHRISAHRALSLNPTVPKINEDIALLGLRTGWADERAKPSTRDNSRWKNQASVALLNDFDFLIQALFAEQGNVSLETHKKVRSGDFSPAKPTKFETLTKVWEYLLPHRKLHISGDNIQVSATEDTNQYPGSEMSDGERAIFYMLGQTLVAAKNSLIIFDEPELHIHRSIMSRLWDKLEAMRSDCAFVFITHDLEFASSRIAERYVLKEYNPKPYWDIEKVPSNSGFDEELTTLILGSRKPILFIEGNNNSLDIAIYRCCFPEWTVIPKGSCEAVIHSVVTLRQNDNFTRITCSGIVDADDYDQEDIAYLNRRGIYTLPVSEIENLILMPTVSRAIAKSEGYSGDELESRLFNLSEKIFNTLNSDRAIEKVVVRFCRRRIDRILKRIDLSDTATVSGIEQKFIQETESLNISNIAQEITATINKALEDKDLPMLLKFYDNKGMIALAASNLKGCTAQTFKSWIIRNIENNNIPELQSSIQSLLPEISQP